MLCDTSHAEPVLEDLKNKSFGTRTGNGHGSQLEPMREGSRRAACQAKHRWCGSGADASSRAGHAGAGP